MLKPNTSPRARTATKAARTALFLFALVLAASVQAQSLDPQNPAGPLDPYAQNPYAGTVVQRPGTRSLFVGTLTALIAQGLGSGIGNALSQGFGGSIARWFSDEPNADQSIAGRPGPSSRDQEGRSALHAGAAYEVQHIGRDGSATAVDPARHVFATGDRFQVLYRTTLPGRVQVFNVDPHGGESRIDSIELAAGQLAALGPYQFVDTKGKETLKLVLQPCSTPTLAAATRRILKTAAATATPTAAAHALRIGDCGDERTRGMRAKARSIRKTTMEGTTAFALDALSDDEIGSGLVAAREIKIGLLHR